MQLLGWEGWTGGANEPPTSNLGADRTTAGLHRVAWGTSSTPHRPPPQRRLALGACPRSPTQVPSWRLSVCSRRSPRSAVAAAPPAAAAARVETVATGLEIPCEIAFLPGGRALVTERPGRMRLLDRRGRLRKAPVARVPVRAYGEGGMLGLALDLAFRANRLVYFYFTATGDGLFIAPLRVYRAPIAPSGATFVAAGARAGR